MILSKHIKAMRWWWYVMLGGWKENERKKLPLYIFSIYCYEGTIQRIFLIRKIHISIALAVTLLFYYIYFVVVVVSKISFFVLVDSYDHCTLGEYVCDQKHNKCRCFNFACFFYFSFYFILGKFIMLYSTGKVYI